ncbi:MAG: IF2 family translation initiation factor [Mycobacteriaceae bacterium]
MKLVGVLRLPYEMWRFPFRVIERQVVSRLPKDALPRVRFERWLGMADEAAGQLLGDRQTARRGEALKERADALSRAVTLEETAQRKRARADEQLEAELEQARKDRAAAQQQQQQAVAETRAAEQARKRKSAQQAQRRARAAKKRADEKAAAQAESVAEAKRAEQARISAQEKAKAKPAAEKLKDAAGKHTEAAAKRSEADRVEELTAEQREVRRAPSS